MDRENIVDLINWYQKNKRNLPWRKTKDPYKIWISEIMLQQTRVEAVKDYYKKFLEVLPTIQDLANIDEDILLKLWEGLGYYSRAKNLKKCANEVLKKGYNTLPKDEIELKKLPGIGPYTAGAILSIAYNLPIPAIDGNVMRVLSRVYEDDRDLLNPKVRKEYEEILKNLIPKNKAREFTEGFIELGALVCLPNGAPLCNHCPLQKCCKANLHDNTDKYPVKKTKTKRKAVNMTVYILKYQNKYALKKRDSTLLQGLYELPNIEEKMSEDELASYLKENNYVYKNIQYIGEEKHIFSHIEWHMEAYLVNLKVKPQDICFYSKDEILTTYSLPTAFKKVFDKVVE